MRELIRDEDPEIVEEVKWAKATSPGTPVWSHDGIICTGEPYKAVAKLTWPTRPSSSTPASRGTRGGPSTSTRKQVDAKAFKALVRAAIERNSSGGKTRR
jgi:hypothetical protein